MSVPSGNWYEAACPNSSTTGCCFPTRGYFRSFVAELPRASLGVPETCALQKCFYCVERIIKKRLAGSWTGPQMGSQLHKALILVFS